MTILLAEEIHVSDQQVLKLIRRLGQLADHEHSNLITEFLDTYRRPVFAYRSMAKLSKVSAYHSSLSPLLGTMPFFFICLNKVIEMQDTDTDTYKST